MVLVSKPKRSTSIHQKRRQGHHHKRSADYHKPYWPYLPLGIIVGLGVLVNSFWGVVQHAVLGYATNTSISRLIEDTNAERATGGLAALTINNKLNQAAQAKANDMATRNYWSHNTPEGSPPWVFFSQAGYEYKAAGENLAYGFDNSDATVEAWMNSPGHRANIMNTNYSEVGFGIANIENYQDTGPQTIVVAMYGSPQVASANANATPTIAAKPKSTPQQSNPAVQPTPTPTPAETKPAETPEPELVVSSELTNELAPPSKNVARIQLFTDDVAPWTIFAITLFATLAIAVVFLRHSLTWHRTFVRGERFILKHKFLDVALVLVGVVGFVLTRTAGSIH